LQKSSIKQKDGVRRKRSVLQVTVTESRVDADHFHARQSVDLGLSVNEVTGFGWVTVSQRRLRDDE